MTCFAGNSSTTGIRWPWLFRWLYVRDSFHDWIVGLQVIWEEGLVLTKRQKREWLLFFWEETDGKGAKQCKRKMYFFHSFIYPEFATFSATFVCDSLETSSFLPHTSVSVFAQFEVVDGTWEFGEQEKRRRNSPSLLRLSFPLFIFPFLSFCFLLPKCICLLHTAILSSEMVRQECRSKIYIYMYSGGSNHTSCEVWGLSDETLMAKAMPTKSVCLNGHGFFTQLHSSSQNENLSLVKKFHFAEKSDSSVSVCHQIKFIV